MSEIRGQRSERDKGHKTEVRRSEIRSQKSRGVRSPGLLFFGYAIARVADLKGISRGYLRRTAPCSGTDPWPLTL